MKKTALIAIIAVLGFLAESAWATVDFSVTNPSQIVAAGSGTFQVTLDLNVTQSSNPANVAGYDAIFEALQSQNGGISNGQFTITGATAPPSQTNWGPVGPGYPDSLTLVGTDHAGYVQSADEGFSGNNSAGQIVATPITNMQLATYTFSYSGLSVGQTYNFQTTLQGTSASKYSDVADQNGSIYPASSSATFSITVVPEPATWSLLGLGGLGSLGLTLLRARRKAS